MAFPSFAHSLAVVIGIDAYGANIPRLTTAVSDATELAERLRADGHCDTAIVLTGTADGEPVTKARLVKLFVEDLPAQLGPDDRLLVYFAGHGIALDGDDGPQGYLMPQDAQPDDRTTFLPMTDVHKWLSALTCRHMLAILDCCFAGAFRWSATRDARPVSSKVLYKERYERYIQSPAWQVITSASYDQRALDVLTGSVVNSVGMRAATRGRHSPFAATLIDALAGAGDLAAAGQRGDGVVTASELAMYLRDTVEVAASEQANAEQTPQIWPLNDKHRNGEFIFLLPGADPEKLKPAPPLNLENNPYRGLESYSEADRKLFFGREHEIRELTALVAAHPFVSVVGASGTGKSSLVKAGLLPQLREDANYVVLPHMRPTDRPISTLETLVHARLGDAQTAAGTPAVAASGDGSPDTASSFDVGAGADFAPDAFAGLVGDWKRRPENAGKRLVLVIDQLEELITLSRDSADHADRTHRANTAGAGGAGSTRDRFLALLAEAVRQHGDVLRLVVSLRTDFEPQFADAPLFTNGADTSTRYVVPPMDIEDLRQAIEGPAGVAVLYFKPSELVDDLIKEVIQTPGALPLLSFTLSELYVKYLERRGDDRSLTAEDYQALGGVIGSLRNRATEEYDALAKDPLSQRTMERIMLRMVAVEGSELTRRRVAESELVYPAAEENARVQAVLAQLVKARLLVSGNLENADGTKGERYYEPAHDALVVAWDKLLQWKQAAETELPLQQQRRLAQEAADWSAAAGEERKGLLWDNDPRLPQVELILWPGHKRQRGARGLGRSLGQVFRTNAAPPKTDTWLNRRETDFVQASVLQRSRTVRRGLLTAAVVIVVLAALAIFAGGKAIEASNANTGLVTANQRLDVTNKDLEQQKASLASTNRQLDDTNKNLETERTNLAVANTNLTLKAREVRQTLAGSLAAQAKAVLETDAPSGALLAVEALNVTQREGEPATAPAIGAALAAVERLGGRGVAISDGRDGLLRDQFSQVSAVSRTGRWLVTENFGSGVYSVWDPSKPELTDSKITFEPRTDPDAPADEASAVVGLGAVSPDERWFATNGRVFDLAQPDPAASPARTIGRNLGFSRDGRWLASIDNRQVTRLWDMHATHPFSSSVELSPHFATADPVFLGTDWIGTTGEDGEHTLWRVEAGALVSVTVPFTDTLLDIGAGGRWLVMAATPTFGPVQLLDLASLGGGDGAQPQDPVRLPGSDGQLQGPSGLSQPVSPDGRWLVTSGVGSASQLWDLQAGDPAASGKPLGESSEPVTQSLFSADSRWLVTLQEPPDDPQGARWSLWDLSRPNPTEGSVNSAGVEELGLPSAQALSINASGQAILLQVQGQQRWEYAILRLPPTGDSPAVEWLDDPSAELRSEAVSPDGRWLFAIHGGDNNTVYRQGRLWDLNEPHPFGAARSFPVPGDLVSHTGISPDGRWLVALPFDKAAGGRLWDLRNPAAESAPVTWPGSRPISVTAASPDYARIASRAAGGAVQLWDLSASTPISQVVDLPGLDGAEVRAMSADGRWLVTTKASDHLKDQDYPLVQQEAVLWRVGEGGAVAASVPLGVGDIRYLQFTKNGRWLLAVDSSGAAAKTADAVHAWDLSAADVAGSHSTLPGPEHDSEIMEVDAPVLAVSPDDRWLAIGLADSTAGVWDLAAKTLKAEDGRMLRVPRLEESRPVTAIAFSPDSKTLATRFPEREERVIRLWGVTETGPMTITRVIGNLNPWIRQIAFSPDGRWLATTGAEDHDTLAGQVMRLWDLSAADPATAWVPTPKQTSWDAPVFTADGRWFATTDANGIRLWPLQPQLLAAAACQAAGRNLDELEWTRFFAGQPYHTTCPDLEVNPNFVDSMLNRASLLVLSVEDDAAVELLRDSGASDTPEADVALLVASDLQSMAGPMSIDPAKREEALALLQDAYARDPESMPDGPEAELNRLAAHEHLTAAVFALQAGDIAKGRAELEQVAASDPKVLGSDPKRRTQELIAGGFISQAEKLAETDVAGGLAALDEARSTFPEVTVPATVSFALCRAGVLGGALSKVTAACDAAVVEAPVEAPNRYARAVARAASGDTAGAARDLALALRLDASLEPPARKQREGWLAELQAGRDPFAGLALEDLAAMLTKKASGGEPDPSRPPVQG